MPTLPKGSRVRKRTGTRKTKGARQIAAAELEQRVLELRASGATYRECAAALGVSHTACEQAYHRALSAIPEADAQEQRQLSMTRIERMRSRLWARFSDDRDKCDHCGVSKQMLMAAMPLLRLEERQSRLLGLDAPLKIDVRLGAPKPFAVDARSREEAVERLTIDEQRELLHLIRKMRGEPPYPLPPYAPQSPTTTVANGHDATDPAAKRLADDLLAGRVEVKDDDDEID
jgi:hypothetical protein